MIDRKSLWKKSFQFLKYARAYLRKGRYASVKVYPQYHLTFINLYIVFFLQWRVHLDGIKMKIWFPSQSLSWGFRAQHLKNFVRVFKPLSTKSG